ncbi:hypothetical protein V5O48_008633 [Marasmius crinis-equi]|uniref:Hydrophobin n=1 Tax=Marasmius crinis-equi TaxID=585013 RepID=A0ABR3FDE5_9AGAR
MLFSKFFALSAMTTLAVATTIAKRGGGGEGGGGGDAPPTTCSGLQCCESVTTASDPSAAAALAAIGVIVGDVNALVGLNCSPITVIGGGSSGCSGSNTAVFCQDNSHGK